MWQSFDDAEKTSYAALFNLSEETRLVSVPLEALGMEGSVTVRDLWRHQDSGRVEGMLTETIPPHGVVLFGLRR